MDLEALIHHFFGTDDPATLTEPAMLAGTWESLKVNTARKLLVGTGVPLLTGVGLMSVYDISDCAHPKLLNPGPGTDLGMLLLSVRSRNCKKLRRSSS